MTKHIIINVWVSFSFSLSNTHKHNSCCNTFTAITACRYTEQELGMPKRSTSAEPQTILGRWAPRTRTGGAAGVWLCRPGSRHMSTRKRQWRQQLWDNELRMTKRVWPTLIMKNVKKPETKSSIDGCLCSHLCVNEWDHDSYCMWQLWMVSFWR